MKKLSKIVALLLAGAMAMLRAFIVPKMPMPEPILLGGKRSDIHVDRQVEQQAKPSPLIILAATISAGLCAKK